MQFIFKKLFNRLLITLFYRRAKLVTVDLGTLLAFTEYNKTVSAVTQDGKVKFHAVFRVTKIPDQPFRVIMRGKVGTTLYDLTIYPSYTWVGGTDYAVDFEAQFPTMPYGTYALLGSIEIMTWSGGFSYGTYVYFASSAIIYRAIAQFTLTILSPSSGGGTTNPVAGAYTYNEGDNVTIIAIPNAGYILQHWLVNGTPVAVGMETLTFTIIQNYTFEPVFASEQAKYNLTISTTVGGTTNPAAGIYIYDKGTIVNLAAFPDASYYFQKWVINGVEYLTSTVAVTMDSDIDAQAFFVLSPLPSPPPIDGTKIALVGASAIALAITLYYLLR